MVSPSLVSSPLLVGGVIKGRRKKGLVNSSTPTRIHDISIPYSAINLCEYKIMRIGQFWRLLNLWDLCGFIARKILAIWQRIYERSKTKNKSGSRTSGRVYTTHYRGINLLVSLYDALLICLDSRLLVSKPQTKEQQRFRLHEHCLTPDLARSTQF